MAGLLTIAPAALLALGAVFAWRAPTAGERLGRFAAPSMAVAAFAAAIAGAWRVLSDPSALPAPLVLSPWAGPAGSYTVVQAHVAAPDGGRLYLQLGEDVDVEVGTRLVATVDPARVTLFDPASGLALA